MGGINTGLEIQNGGRFLGNGFNIRFFVEKRDGNNLYGCTLFSFDEVCSKREETMSEAKDDNCRLDDFVKNLFTEKFGENCRAPMAEDASGTISKHPVMNDVEQTYSNELSWLQDVATQKRNHGDGRPCDPQQSGHIVNNQTGTGNSEDVIYRYSRSLRGTDEAMQELFSDLVVEDEDGKIHRVPIIHGTQEKAAAYVLQQNVRKDETGVVERPVLPLLAIHSSGMQFDQSRYLYHKAIDYLRVPQFGYRPSFTTNERFERDTVFGVTRGLPYNVDYQLYAWTLYEEDMVQIIEQIVSKFSPIAYITVNGISWEITVEINNVSSNVNFEAGDKEARVFKYQFGFTTKTFIAQPIIRKKAVLETRVEMTDSPEDVAEVYSRLEESVKYLKGE